MKSCFLKIFLVIFFFASYDVLAKTQPAKKQNSKTKSEAEVLFQKYNENKKDHKLSMKYLKEAAQKGHVEAQYHLGIFSKDEKEREKWWTLSAEAGHVKAMSSLSNHFSIREDYSKAFFWCQKAAEKGDVYSQRMLGMTYLLGNGVDLNLTLARKWFSKAASAGDEEAKKQLEKIKKTDECELLLKRATQNAYYASIYEDQPSKQKEFLAESFRLLKKASLRGSREAMRRLYNSAIPLVKSQEETSQIAGLRLLFFTAKLGYQKSYNLLKSLNVSDYDIMSFDLNSL